MAITIGAERISLSGIENQQVTGELTLFTEATYFKLFLGSLDDPRSIISINVKSKADICARFNAWTCKASKRNIEWKHEGIWDIGYYFWLWIFIGWPRSFGTTDLLFLLPVPWIAPVAAPMIVSVALLGFGLIAAIRINRGELLILKRKDWSIISAGGIIVAVSFTFDAGHILLGGMPRAFLWPVFAIGMAVAGHGARTIVLTRSRPI